MLVLSLILCALVTLLVAAGIVALQYVRISKGQISVEDDYNGPAHVQATLLAIIRFFFRRSVYLRKFVLQYVAHVAVRVMYYIDKLTTYLYSKSRNWFVRNAVRNRGTVPHFWQHLKVYKQEMDKERDEIDN
jgi:hypothetical protein